MAFQKALREIEPREVLDRFYSNAVSPILGNEKEAALRREISSHFATEFRAVQLTGSAKLGFTLTQKPQRPPFSSFGDASDIDVAIISHSLFVRVWKETNNFRDMHGSWNSIGDFRRYLARGWIRPDKLPIGEHFPFGDEWFEYFRKLTASDRFGRVKVSAGIYYDESFWETYALDAIRKARTHMEVLS